MTTSEANDNLKYINDVWRGRKSLIENLLYLESEGVLIDGHSHSERFSELVKKCNDKLSFAATLRDLMNETEQRSLIKQIQAEASKELRLRDKIRYPSLRSTEELNSLVAERDECCSRRSSLQQQLEQLDEPIFQKIHDLLEELRTQQECSFHS